MIAQRSGGVIVNMASMGGKVGSPNQAHYAASKAAVIALTPLVVTATARATAPTTIASLRSGSRSQNVVGSTAAVRFYRPVPGSIGDGFGAPREGGRRHAGGGMDHDSREQRDPQQADRAGPREELLGLAGGARLGHAVARHERDLVRYRDNPRIISTLGGVDGIDWNADPVTGAQWPRVYHRDVPVHGGNVGFGDVKAAGVIGAISNVTT